MTTPVRRVGAAALALTVVAAFVGCGDDGDDDAAGDTDTTEEAGGGLAGGERIANDEFCEAFTGLDQAFAQTPQDPQAFGEFVEQEVSPRIEAISDNLPDDEELADAVTTMVETTEEVLSSGDPSAFQSSEFAEAQAVIYPALSDACDLPTVEVTAVDYAFEGVPDSIDPGTTVFVMKNESASGEAHEMAIARPKDGVTESAEELVQLPQDELESKIELVGGLFALDGQTGGTTLDLSPGRYVYLCFVPVGSVEGAEGTGPPHASQGMYGQFTVE